MVHQADQPQSPGMGLCLRRHGTESEAVDDHQRVVRYRRQQPVGRLQRRPIGEREAVGEPPQADLPAQGRQSSDYPTVVEIAARGGRRVAGNQKFQCGHGLVPG